MFKIIPPKEQVLKNIPILADILIVYAQYSGHIIHFSACTTPSQNHIRNIAINQGFVTKYIRMPDMLTELHQPEANKNKLRKKYAAPEVLIVDEWLTSEDIDNDDISFLLDLMEDRSDTKSTIFCTLYPSVIDRIVHSAVIIDCGTMNMRAEKRKR